MKNDTLARIGLTTLAFAIAPAQHALAQQLVLEEVIVTATPPPAEKIPILATINHGLESYDPYIYEEAAELMGVEVTEAVDFVIVGSGSAGGILAKELSANGFRIVVLEQGPVCCTWRPAW